MPARVVVLTVITTVSSFPPAPMSRWIHQLGFTAYQRDKDCYGTLVSLIRGLLKKLMPPGT
jgi:hypothetical protein